MITIDLIDEHVTTTEKPAHWEKPHLPRRRLGVLDRLCHWVQNPQNDLLKAAHTARLLKMSREANLSIDVQRYAEIQNCEKLSLAERYANRQVL